jgi:hypothetical protein
MLYYENGALTPRRVQKSFKVALEYGHTRIGLSEIQVLFDRYRIVAFDQFGPLPVMEVENTGDSFKDGEAVENAACQLAVVARHRVELYSLLPGCYLSPVVVTPNRVTRSGRVFGRPGPATAKKKFDANNPVLEKIGLRDEGMVDAPGSERTLCLE